MLSIFNSTINEAKILLIKSIKNYVKSTPNSIVKIDDYVDFYTYSSTQEGDSLKLIDTFYVGCLRVDTFGEVVIDYKDDEDAYTEVLSSFSFDELVNICEKIK